MSDSKHIFYDYIMLKSHPTFLFLSLLRNDLISICYAINVKRMKFRFTMIVVTAVYLAGTK